MKRKEKKEVCFYQDIQQDGSFTSLNSLSRNNTRMTSYTNSDSVCLKASINHINSTIQP